MGKILSKITEASPISVGFALLIGSWVVSVETRVNANTIINEVGNKGLSEAQRLLTKIDRRLSRIEGALRIEQKEKPE